MSDFKYKKDPGNKTLESFGAIAYECRACAIDHGFPLHDKLPQLVAFMSEVGEWAEAIRKDDKDNELEEIVDVMVRIFAYAEEHFPSDWKRALVQKMQYNRLRPFKHGKEF